MTLIGQFLEIIEETTSRESRYWAAVKSGFNNWDDYKISVLEKEKQAIIDAYSVGLQQGVAYGASPGPHRTFITSEQYYKETYNK